MKILEIWSNLSAQGLEIHSSFFHICLLFFVNFKKQKFDAISQNLIFTYTNI
jgi:hypothetical protein